MTYNVRHGIVYFHFFCSYTVYDLYAENFYLVDLKLSVCWETYEPCEFEAQLFKNKMLLKRTCPGNMTFEHSGKYL